MFIELTEVLACPACLVRDTAPAQGLVAVVERLHGRHVLEGYLGCPACEARYRVRDGVIDFEPAAAGPEPETAGTVDARFDPGRVTEIAALLGLGEEAGGTVVLDRGLSAAAEPLAALQSGAQLLGLLDRMPSEEMRLAAAEPGQKAGGHGAPLVSYARVGKGGPMPVGNERLRAVVLQIAEAEADRASSRLREAVRGLQAGGRLVILRPSGAVREAADDLPLRVLASEERALVAVRG